MASRDVPQECVRSAEAACQGSPFALGTYSPLARAASYLQPDLGSSGKRRDCGDARDTDADDDTDSCSDIQDEDPLKDCKVSTEDSNNNDKAIAK